VIAYSSSMAPYAELAGDIPKVLDMVDVDSAKWRQYSRFAALPMRPVYALEARRLQAYEAALSKTFDSVVFATGNEAELYRSFTPGARTSTIPNGIDLDFFRRLDLPRSPHPTLVFTGQMDYFANVDGIVHFAREVFPGLRRRFADLELLIVGRSPAPSVRALGDLPGVAVTGAVGDVRPFLSRAWAFVAPLRITQGVQNKVLEAMATSLPVVCSERVFAGVSDGGFRHDRDLLVAATDEEMERSITLLLQEPQTRERLAESARRRLAATYRWEPFLEGLEDLISGARSEGEEVPEPLAGGARSA
jgi:sugar transferase (PEP-CTERM/EpsH1 system associated)